MAWRGAWTRACRRPTSTCRSGRTRARCPMPSSRAPMCTRRPTRRRSRTVTSAVSRAAAAPAVAGSRARAQASAIWPAAARREPRVVAVPRSVSAPRCATAPRAKNAVAKGSSAAPSSPAAPRARPLATDRAVSRVVAEISLVAARRAWTRRSRATAARVDLERERPAVVASMVFVAATGRFATSFRIPATDAVAVVRSAAPWRSA